MLQTSKIEYVHGNQVLEGYCAVRDPHIGNKPAVIVAHDWSGRNEFACQKAEQLAELGYVGFALDMYGNGRLGHTKEEKSALMMPLKENRALLRQRILSAYETVKKLMFVDVHKIAVIGFCFGGLCALDLARGGADIRGVVSFHGLLDAPTDVENKKILAKVLALHGQLDPMVSSAAVAAFQHEMTAARVDWQMHIYGHTLHAFTNPQAHDTESGLVYNQLADKRAWVAAKNFLAEIFA